MRGHDIIVVGASAGGLESMLRILPKLPEDLPASIFIVVHLPAHTPSRLPELLQRSGALPAQAAIDGARFERGRVYVAPPDHHLLVEHEVMRVVRGPKENLSRPSIDPLFRSAAYAHGPHVIGVILSGSLDDGTSGLWAVKTCGGVAIIQDPSDASFSEMPANALRAVHADHCVPATAIAPLLAKLAAKPVKRGRTTPSAEKLKVEIDFATMGRQKDIDDMDTLGKPSAFTCPACRGSLWELEDGELLRFRCHVGHAFSTDSLMVGQTREVEEALYSALRALEEKASTSRRIGERMGERLPHVRARYEATARTLEEEAAVVRQLIANRTE